MPVHYEDGGARVFGNSRWIRRAESASSTTSRRYRSLSVSVIARPSVLLRLFSFKPITIVTTRKCAHINDKAGRSIDSIPRVVREVGHSGDKDRAPPPHTHSAVGNSRWPLGRIMI